MLEGGAEFGRRRWKQVAGPVLGRRQGRSVPWPPGHPPGDVVVPTCTVSVTVRPTFPRRPRRAESAGRQGSCVPVQGHLRPLGRRGEGETHCFKC